MTSLVTRAPATPARIIQRGVFGLARQLVGSLWRSWLIHERCRELHAMPDDLLKDVGISRGDIESIAAALVDRENDPTRIARGRN